MTVGAVRHMESLRQLLTFSVVGVINTAIGLSVIWLASWLGANPYLANVLGYAFGLTNSFLMNRAFTFRQAGRGPGVVPRFAIAFCIAYGCNLALLTIGLAIDPGREFLWQCVSMVGYTGVFFILSKWFVFR